jgi:hypothetical protein
MIDNATTAYSTSRWEWAGFIQRVIGPTEKIEPLGQLGQPHKKNGSTQLASSDPMGQGLTHLCGLDFIDTSRWSLVFWSPFLGMRIELLIHKHIDWHDQQL